MKTYYLLVIADDKFVCVNSVYEKLENARAELETLQDEEPNMVYGISVISIGSDGKIKSLFPFAPRRILS